MMRYKIGQTVFLERCEKCNNNNASGIVAKPIRDDWFFNCNKCGTMQHLDQQLID